MSSELGFSSLSLDGRLLRVISELGYTQPTPIQEQAIPVVLGGSDIIASARTGSGKTASFLLPILQRLSDNVQSTKGPRSPKVLILGPTRELVQQIADAATDFGKYIPRIRVTTLYGGVGYGRQISELKAGPDIIIATPGRLMDHMERGRIDFSQIDSLILDEADRMLDMGFLDDVHSIMGKLPPVRQTLLFSATIDKRIEKLSAEFLQTPVRIKVDSAEEAQRSITERLYLVRSREQKDELLNSYLAQDDVRQVIVFTATKRDSDRLTEVLREAGHRAASIHSDIPQRERTRTIERMRKESLKVLVATDIASRGIDVPTISHVVNFDLPRTPEDYVHRIGRTGRGGAEGIAISLILTRERKKISHLERHLGRRLSIEGEPEQPRREVRKEQGQVSAPRKERRTASPSRRVREEESQEQRREPRRTEKREESSFRPARRSDRRTDRRSEERRGGEQRRSGAGERRSSSSSRRREDIRLERSFTRQKPQKRRGRR